MYIVKICENCKKEYNRKKGYNVKGRFCSHKCWYDWVVKNPKPFKGYTEQKRFEVMREKFEKNVIKKKGCWDWKSYCDPFGYPRFGIGRTEKIRGHIASWLLFRGKLEKGKYIFHHCDNPRCTNPEHLFIGTPKDNVQDAIKKGRIVKVFGRPGSKKPRPNTSGSKNPSAKLNEKQVKEIREMLNIGISGSKIANKFKVGNTTISRIKAKTHWKKLI